MDPPAPNVALVRLRMYHTDLVGVFHGRIFELFEEARTEVFRHLGFTYQSLLDRGVVMIVTHVEASFSRPLRVVDEPLECAVFVSHLGRARLTVEYEVRRAGEAAAAVTGHTAFAFVDTARNRPVPVPAEIRATIERCPAMLKDGA